MPSKFIWPSSFPRECPPATAGEQEITAYRLVKNDPPQAEDFVPVAMNPTHPHQPFPAEKLCMACGLSVFQTLDGVRNTRQKFKGFRDRLIAQGDIGLSDGVILKTSADSHVTWWTTLTEPHLKFPVIVADD
jgi:hypothetical protein